MLFHSVWYLVLLTFFGIKKKENLGDRNPHRNKLLQLNFGVVVVLVVVVIVVLVVVVIVVVVVVVVIIYNNNSDL